MRFAVSWTISRALPPMPERSTPSQGEQAGREDVAILVPFFGVVLLMPPLLNLFDDLQAPFGVPLEVLYLFGVWLLVIAGAVLLSRRKQFRETTPVEVQETVRPSSAAPAGDA